MTDTKIVCLSGSMRFYAAMLTAASVEETAGRIILMPYPTGGAEADLARHHRAKIDLADEVLVINPGGYIGNSTAREIGYATEVGKPVRYLEQP